MPACTASNAHTDLHGWRGGTFSSIPSSGQQAWRSIFATRPPCRASIPSFWNKCTGTSPASESQKSSFANPMLK